LTKSSDLTILDYFLWDYIKDIVYQTALTILKDMKRRIIDVLTYQKK